MSEEVKKLRLLPKSKKIGGKLHLAGTGNLNASIVFVGPCVLEEEMLDAPTQPAMLKGPAADLLLRQLSRAEIPFEEIYYTTVVRYPLDRKQKLKPTAEQIHQSAAYLFEELAVIKPKIIVALSADVFKLLTKVVVKYQTIIGGFFYSDALQARVFAMDKITSPIYKPELIDKQQIDIYELSKLWKQVQNVHVSTIELDYKVINKVEDLLSYTRYLEDIKVNELSVDCEWAGTTFVDGRLRSIQLCHTPGCARYLQFTNENGDWMFDSDDFEPIKQALLPIVNKPDFGWVGHNLSADMVWLKNHIGLPVYKKAAFDTMYAEYDVDEYSDLKLERLSIKYTDLGRYDVSLALKKKELKITKSEGYERIPDEILIPYALRDADVPMRAKPFLLKALEQQELTDYYRRVTLPLVTDVFVTMMETGMPTSMDLLLDMRDTYYAVRDELDGELKEAILKEARTLILLFLKDKLKLSRFIESLDTINTALDTGVIDKLVPLIEEAELSKEDMATFVDLVKHFQAAPSFNIRSYTDMARWLFKVKKHKPVKTTKTDMGFEISWEKVERMKPERRMEFKPSTDKQTLKIISEKDPLVYKVLEVNSVGNIIKSYLKKNKEDEDTELDRPGVAKWIQSDNRIHTNFALVESARPRSWKWLHSIETYCANCFNCWDGGGIFPISSQDTPYSV